MCGTCSFLFFMHVIIQRRRLYSAVCGCVPLRWYTFPVNLYFWRAHDETYIQSRSSRENVCISILRRPTIEELNVHRGERKRSLGIVLTFLQFVLTYTQIADWCKLYRSWFGGCSSVFRQCVSRFKTKEN